MKRRIKSVLVEWPGSGESGHVGPSLTDSLRFVLPPWFACWRWGRWQQPQRGTVWTAAGPWWAASCVSHSVLSVSVPLRRRRRPAESCIRLSLFWMSCFCHLRSIWALCSLWRASSSNAALVFWQILVSDSFKNCFLPRETPLMSLTVSEWRCNEEERPKTRDHTLLHALLLYDCVVPPVYKPL